MSQNQKIKKFHKLVINGNYLAAIGVLKRIKNKQVQIDECYMAVTGLGIMRACDEYGEVKVYGNKEEYDRAKIGLDDCSPYAVLYGGNFAKETEVEGLEDMLDFVPEDNPLKQYYRILNI